MPSLGQRPRQPLLLSPTLKGPWSLTMCCTLWAGFLIHPLRQLCDKGTMSPKMSQDESQSQMPKIMVTEPGSPLQVNVRMGWGPIPHPPWEHRAAALSEGGLSGLEKWSHAPGCCPTVLTHLPLWERKRTEMKSCPFCQLTSVSGPHALAHPWREGWGSGRSSGIALKTGDLEGGQVICAEVF